MAERQLATSRSPVRQDRPPRRPARRTRARSREATSAWRRSQGLQLANHRPRVVDLQSGQLLRFAAVPAVRTCATQKRTAAGSSSRSVGTAVTIPSATTRRSLSLAFAARNDGRLGNVAQFEPAWRAAHSRGGCATARTHAQLKMLTSAVRRARTLRSPRLVMLRAYPCHRWSFAWAPARSKPKSPVPIGKP